METSQTKVPWNLDKAEFAFVGQDCHRGPLSSNYGGPFRIISRIAKYFIWDLGNRQDKVSIDRLKCVSGASAANVQGTTASWAPAPRSA